MASIAREVRDSEGEVVAVEAVGVSHEPLPGDVDGDEEPREAEEAGRRVILHELVGKPGYRNDEDEVEEELEPGRTALVHLVRGCSQSRRHEPARPPIPARRPDGGVRRNRAPRYADAHRRSA
jgi:hypothetical protein